MSWFEDVTGGTPPRRRSPADAQLELSPPDTPTPPRVEVRRSARRRRTVHAYRDGDRTVVLIPDRFTKREEREWVADMLAKLDARDRKEMGGAKRGDSALAERAAELSERYLDGRARPATVRWVREMSSRWASCTPADRSIRISERLKTMPSWVLDYVLVHELAHLLVRKHNHRFWSLVERYPRTERARGYLEGVAAAAQLTVDDEDVASR